MEDPTTYAWHSTYIDTVSEMDRSIKPVRIQMLLKTLEDRCTEIDRCSPEHRAIEIACRALNALKALNC